LSGPLSTDTPVSLAFQGAFAGGGTGEVASAILGRLGSVSAIEASGTPVGQGIRLQSQSPSQGTAGGLGTPPPTERPGGILGGAFGGLGVLGRTDGMSGTAGLADMGGLGGLDGLDDIEAPDFDGQTFGAVGAAPPAENAALADAGEATGRDGHRGLRWQMTAARSATGEPVAALVLALESLADSRSA